MRDLNSVCYFWLVRDVIHDWKVRYKMNERESKATGLPFKKVRSYTRMEDKGKRTCAGIRQLRLGLVVFSFPDIHTHAVFLL